MLLVFKPRAAGWWEIWMTTVAAMTTNFKTIHKYPELRFKLTTSGTRVSSHYR